jgi:hypothetical protein
MTMPYQIGIISIGSCQVAIGPLILFSALSADLAASFPSSSSFYPRTPSVDLHVQKSASS